MSPLHKFVMSSFVLAAATNPVWAASSASSASSESVGSSSTSIEKSSKSSSKDDKVAEGDYRVIGIEIATADTQAGRVRVTLQAVNGNDGEFFLVLPQEAAQQGRLAQGTVVTARQHAYGIQFAAGAPRQAFFLVLRDEWYQELQTRVVTL